MAPRIDHYEWAGGREMLLRFGPDSDGDTAPVVVATLPLFEEANRTRTLTVGLLRALAARGIAGLLPDVPGQNESLTPLAGLTLSRMAGALASVAPGRRTYAIGIRSGALLDHVTPHRGRWHFCPQTGVSLLRDLHRAWRAAGKGGNRDVMLRNDPVEIAGNRLPVGLLSSLSAAQCSADRIVRLVGDLAEADRWIEAAPLWHRAEPDADPVLVQVLADDIAEWIASCEA